MIGNGVNCTKKFYSRTLYQTASLTVRPIALGSPGAIEAGEGASPSSLSLPGGVLLPHDHLRLPKPVPDRVNGADRSCLRLRPEVCPRSFSRPEEDIDAA